MNYDHQVTGQVIRTLRLRKNMTQEELSNLSGVPRTHLSHIENGSKNANVTTLWRIAPALDMRLSELLRLVEDKTWLKENGFIT